MKKTLTSLAVAAGILAAGAANAAPIVYGNAHLSLNAADNDVPGANNNLRVSSNTSSIGVKGSEDLGGGLKAIYKIEYAVAIGTGPDTTPDDAGAVNGEPGFLTGRDQFVGLKSGVGTFKFGSVSSNYKQTGSKVDPLYRTPLEGRGFLGTQSSALHGGKGINRGRQTHTAQYTSPNMGGVKLVVNTTFSGSEEETTGIGVRYSNKNILAYVDFIDGQASATAVQTAGAITESAVKVGGKFSDKSFSVSGQYESAEDRTGFDYLFLGGTFNVSKNNTVILTYGQASAITGGVDTDGVAAAFNHKMSKQTNVYVGYGAHSSDAPSSDESMLTAGIRKKF